MGTSSKSVCSQITAAFATAALSSDGLLSVNRFGERLGVAQTLYALHEKQNNARMDNRIFPSPKGLPARH